MQAEASVFKGWRWSLEAGKGRETGSPLEPLEGADPAESLILT